MTDDNKHDVVMIGAGPAALTVAIYTTREDIETVLFERGVVGDRRAHDARRPRGNRTAGASQRPQGDHRGRAAAHAQRLHGNAGKRAARQWRVEAR